MIGPRVDLAAETASPMTAEMLSVRPSLKTRPMSADSCRFRRRLLLCRLGEGQFRGMTPRPGNRSGRSERLQRQDALSTS